MGAGRPRKSEAKKDIAGTDRNDRRRSVVPEPEAVVIIPKTYPPPPDYLTDRGHSAYYAICEHLKRVDALWKVDAMLIGKAAFWMQLWEEAVIEVRGNTIQTFPNGAQQISPQLQVLDKAEQHVKKYYELLGIGVSAREGIGVFQVSGGDDAQDPFALMLKELDKVELPIDLA